MVQQIREAYDTFVANIKEFDTSEQGMAQWKQAEATYTQSTAEIETQFAILIKDKLSKAPTPKDKFIVFSFYNQLLKRKKVRGAIQNYQSDLLSQVKSDIDALSRRILQEKKHNHSLSTARDFPDISNRVIWID